MRKDIQLVKISRPLSRESAWLVRRGETNLGIVSKFKDTKTEWHPYKALKALPTDAPAVLPLLGVFYPGECGGATQAKTKAVEAILRAA